jgi:hypothetical protein
MFRSVMRSIGLLSLIAACDSTSPAGEHLEKTDQRFTSGEAVLLDFEFDGLVIVDSVGGNDPDARRLIEAQLMYTVGQLNGDRAVGRFERLELSDIALLPAPQGRSEVSYHARFPVAWGGTSIPASYTLIVPAQVAEADQMRFAAQYGTTCADTSAGKVNAGSMFLFYRPQHASCTLAPKDVVRAPATIKPSAENTNGKYPEYQRIWEDRALKVVAMFSRGQKDPDIVDDGSLAYDEFVRRAREYLLSVQPNDGDRAITVSTGRAPTANLRATLPDGRSVTIDTMLVGYRLADDGASFDTWYDALTPAADLIVYNGHSGLGDNVRALMEKGTFLPRQYAIWFLNGCDTLAYVDRTLADRRALLNPDDPFGTKYMDTVSNVMGAYFADTPATSMTFIETVVAAGAGSEQAEPGTAKTYPEIFTSIAPEQLVVVTGEEDNEFQPRSPFGAPGIVGAPAVPLNALVAGPPDDKNGVSCDAGGGHRSNDVGGLSAVIGLVVVVIGRRRVPPRGEERRDALK